MSNKRVSKWEKMNFQYLTKVMSNNIFSEVKFSDNSEAVQARYGFPKLQDQENFN